MKYLIDEAVLTITCKGPVVGSATQTPHQIKYFK